MKFAYRYLLFVMGLVYPLSGQEHANKGSAHHESEITEVQALPEVHELLELVKNEELPVPEVEEPSRLKVWFMIIGYKVFNTYLQAKAWLAGKLSQKAKLTATA